jgi:GT2 family glycosyltransferase
VNPVSATGAGLPRVPAHVRDVEVTEPLPAIEGWDGTGRRYPAAWLLVRVHTEPVGCLELPVPEAGIAPQALAAAVEAALGDQIRPRLARSAESPFLARRAEVLRAAGTVTVVICTRNRPAQLSRTLYSVLAQEYPRLRVLVVDNAPDDDATERVVRAAAGRGAVRYLREPVPGLSRARNAALAATAGELVAWIDDDVVADRYWLAELARALADHPEAGVVTGAVVPAELETAAQVWFEQFGGLVKGRGFAPAVFHESTLTGQSPLFPLPPFGAGANMLTRPGVLESVGGFDPALGAGTASGGGEDTLAFSEILRTGGTIAYQPTSLVRHYHRRDLDGLRRQLVGYGSGLTAVYASLLRRDPGVLPQLLRLAPGALREVLGSKGRRTATIGPDFPRELLRANRRAMARGPFAYLRSHRQAARR